MGLHAAWHLLYGPLAWLFDPITRYVSGGHWQAWGRISLAYLPRGRVLELAHGPGHLLVALRRAGYRPVGIDRSPPMGRLAGQRLRGAGLLVPLVRARAQVLPFRKGSFDAVVAAFPTDYIFDPDTLREVARVTSADGRLVIVAGAQRRGAQPDRHFLDWLEREIGTSHPRHDGAASAFAQAGLRARIECPRVDGTMVILIVAEKVSSALVDVPSLTDADLEELTQLQPALTFGERHGAAAPHARALAPIGDLASSTDLRAR